MLHPRRSSTATGRSPRTVFVPGHSSPRGAILPSGGLCLAFGAVPAVVGAVSFFEELPLQIRTPPKGRGFPPFFFCFGDGPLRRRLEANRRRLEANRRQP